jgi:hypothetical protein
MLDIATAGSPEIAPWIDLLLKSAELPLSELYTRKVAFAKQHLPPRRAGNFDGAKYITLTKRTDVRSGYECDSLIPEIRRVALWLKFLRHELSSATIDSSRLLAARRNSFRTGSSRAFDRIPAQLKSELRSRLEPRFVILPRKRLSRDFRYALNSEIAAVQAMKSKARSQSHPFRWWAVLTPQQFEKCGNCMDAMFDNKLSVVPTL